ncbi:uncharacterized protein LOC111074071 [Drosophila obscura]|uniref:uncharacterized protein LOC111074071 n=1 Tax=Drosophila obscura TaxID=7282 RepID=UPI001BB16679|nr:uncharacterized protein LOC111074071 [Drosophila obscura]
MEPFGNDKNMGHSWDFLSPRNEEVDECTQTDSSRTQDVDSASDDPRSSAGNESANAQATPKKGCLKGSPPESGNERIFVLRNCNQCKDYTVSPCGRCKCPRKTSACMGNCKGTDDTADSCPLRQSAPAEAQRRRAGGTCPLCQSRNGDDQGVDGLCGGLCKECNSRIHDAMGKYFSQRGETAPYYQTPAQSLYQPYSAQVFGYPSFPYSVTPLPMPLPPVQQAWGCRKSKSPPTECDMRQPSGNNCECPRPSGLRPSQQSGQLAPQLAPQQAPQQTIQVAPQQAPQQQAGQWVPINSGPSWSPQQPQQQAQQQVQQILADPNSAAPLNIIVLQDCDNNALIDQLTTAISRSGGHGQEPGQGHATLGPPPPGYSNYNSYNNPLSGYIDYEMVDFNRGSQQQYNRNMDYDDGYSMDMDGYMDGSRSSCDMGSCPAKAPAPGSCACKSRTCTCQCCPNECKTGGGGGGNGENKCCNCDCNCPSCECKSKQTECDATCGADCARKCCKTDLSALLKQALEIFIGLSEEPKKKKKHRPYSSYSKKKGPSNADYIKIKRGKNRQRVASGSATMVQNQASKDDFALSRATSEFNGPHTANHTALPTPAQSTMPSPSQTHTHTPRESLHELGRSRSSNYLAHGSEAAPFFLPNCEKNRCKHDCVGRCSKPPHNCSKGCKSHCKGPCHKRGGGDATSKRRERDAAVKNARCFQCNAGKVVDSGRKWQKVDTDDIQNERPNTSKPNKSAAGCAGCMGGSARKLGGAGNVRYKIGLLGLSPIAHYRPGMLQFPVNYLLTGADTRRSLVRTAAGVTLHQSPYVDLTEGRKVQPPKKNRKRSKDRRRAAKKWQTVPSLPPAKYALSGIEKRD